MHAVNEHLQVDQKTMKPAEVAVWENLMSAIAEFQERGNGQTL